MRMVGLTGGIASGKSTTSKEFKTLGLPIIDADKIAHAALKKGTIGYRKVVAAFGNSILLENGDVNRTRLGEIIFSDPTKRQVLNSAMSFSIAWGIYWAIFEHWIKGTEVVIMDIPLLFEAKLNKLTKPIIVVWVDSKTEEERLVKRDGISKELAAKKIASQFSLDWKRDHADIVIYNTGTVEELKGEVVKVYERITAPLNWRERLLSRSGVLTVVVTFFSFWFFGRR